MFCRRAQWEGARFPRQLFYHAKSRRGKVLMHSKVLCPFLVFLLLSSWLWYQHGNKRSVANSETAPNALSDDHCDLPHQRDAV